MTMDNGGYAFPAGELPDPRIVDTKQRGMTLRDWFAGQALTGLLAKATKADGLHYSYAADAYAYADEMLKEHLK